MVRRHDLLKAFASMVSDGMLVVTPIGGTSKTWEEMGRSSTSLSAVSLGMCTPAALGLALALPHRRVIALDSDGNLILNLCSLGTVGNQNPANLTIIVFDNGNYLSGGPGKGKPGMPTATAGKMNLEAIAKGCGIEKAFTVDNEPDFRTIVQRSLREDGPWFIRAKVDPVDVLDSTVYWYRQNTRENKYSFVRHVERLEKITILKGGGA